MATALDAIDFLLHPTPASLDSAGSESVSEPLCSDRSLRASVKVRAGMAQTRDAGASPSRAFRGEHLTNAPSVWRRCEMGTNRIACKGIWRKGSRRIAARKNRVGDTDWHLCGRRTETRNERVLP